MKTKEEFNNEYTALCAKLGELNFKIHVMTLDLERVKTQITELFREFEAQQKRAE
jgi:hypothetical protein